MDHQSVQKERYKALTVVTLLNEHMFQSL